MLIGDFTLVKNGTSAALAATATAVHDGNGCYIIALTTTNTDTLGRLAIYANKATYTMAIARFSVLTAATFDAIITNAAGSANGLFRFGDVLATVTNLTNLPAAPTDWLTAAGIAAAAVTKIQAGLSTYAGGDTSGTTILLGRLTSVRATALDNLDAAVSTRSVYAGGAVASVTAAVAVDLTRSLGTPRDMSAVADGSLTVNDALWSAIGAGAGRKDLVGTTITLATPSTHTTLRTYTIDSATAPTFLH